MGMRAEDWAKTPPSWSARTRRIFERTYEQIRTRQGDVKHPTAPMLVPRFWDTVAWNCAYLAACCAEGTTVLVEEEGGSPCLGTTTPTT